MRPSRMLISLSIMLGMTQPVFSAAAFKCSTGELFAGAPTYADPSKRAKTGQGLRDVPPLGFRSLVFAGDRLVTAVGSELWFSDLAAEAPTLQRFAGRELANGHQALPGPCGEARFGNISGIAFLPDGAIAGADQTANLIFLVTDPFGPACTVTFIAGATAPQPSLNPNHPDGVGDADGPGAKALLRTPEWVAAADDGALFFIDSENAKLKKVLPDTAHTVQTVGDLPDGHIYALIALNEKLYIVGNNDASEGFLTEIDPATGDRRDVLKGRSDIWLSDGAINLSGLTTDGENLITTQSGQVLYVTLKGDVESIAGNGTYFEFQPDYDGLASHPAADLQLWTARRTPTAGANVFLAYRDGQLYVSAAGTSPYVERIACQ